MALGVNKIEDDACQMKVGIEMAKSIQDRGSRIGHCPGVQYEDDRQTQQLGEISGAAFALYRTVEQSHDAFRDSHINIGRIGTILVADMSGAHHIQVEVDAVAAHSGLVMNGVDEIGP